MARGLSTEDKVTSYRQSTSDEDESRSHSKPYITVMRSDEDVIFIRLTMPDKLGNYFDHGVGSCK